MKFAIVGAGAIGGYLGGRLAAAGDEVTLVARGPNLEALRAHGIRLKLEDGTHIQARDIRAVESVSEAGPQDVVLLTLKAHQVGPIAADLAALCHDDTTIVTMQNGIPWWYFHRHGGAYEGTAVKTADPDGRIARHVDPRRVIGSVVYPAATLVAPGQVEVIEGNRFGIGELDGTTTPRLQALAQALIKAGFKAPITKDIRAEIWMKLWGNATLNPISALTHATLQDMCRFAPTRALIATMMAEVEAVAASLGVRFKISIEKRIAGAEAVGAHKTSMLQDVELGRPLELEALVGSVVELAQLTGTPVPNVAAIYACTQLLAQSLAAAGGRLKIT
ncbi:MAG TPA: 2-dehydropantoate 2-reductase [Burkholderiaceae bacterium]|nr:2-dehydropantoate 2-reductase [Burkholderiaceae bacterium]